jgi:hypothetical protein
MEHKAMTLNIDLDAELAEMKKRVDEAEKVVNENAYHVLLKLWGKIVAITFAGGLIGALVLIVILSQYPQAIPSELFSTTKIENAVSIILAPSVTTIGLVLGFTPVISFFFVNALKDDKIDFKEQETRFFKQLSGNEQFETKENISLAEMYYAYLNLIIHNRISGVLKYVGTFLILSLLTLPLLIEAAIVLNSLIFFVLDLLLILFVVEGVFPIITLSTYKPAIRITEHLVPGTVPNTLAIMKTLESEDEMKTDKQTAEVIKLLKQAAKEKKENEKTEAGAEKEDTEAKPHEKCRVGRQEPPISVCVRACESESVWVWRYR